MKTVYLSGPITGLTYQDARYGWRGDFTKLLTSDINVLSPMRHEGHLAEITGPLAENYPTHLFSHSKMIVNKDFMDIRRSDLMVLNVMGAMKVVSRGSLVELGYAAAIDVPIVLIIEPEGNIHDYPFVIENSMVRLDNLQDAATAVNSLMSEGL